MTIERAQVWLARHGETQRTRSGQHTGRTLTLGWERETRLIQRWNLA